MKFRDDIDPATTWVVSDTHFGHDNIVGYCARPEDHEQIMIAEWRKWVPDDATVLHLGDLAYSSNGRFKHIVAKELTGTRKLLIQGNHDRQRFSFYRAAGFSLVKPFKIEWGALMRECKMCHGEGWVGGMMGETCPECDGRQFKEYPWTISFCHYPWNETEDGPQGPFDIRIHGHIHNNGYTRDGYVPFLKNHINLSVEQTRYRPVNLKLLLDAALTGNYPETTDEQLAEARNRRHASHRNPE